MRARSYVASLVVLAAACGHGADVANFQEVRSSLARDAAPAVTPEDQALVAADGARFALDLYHGVTSMNDGNVFFSPYSITSTLAMTYAGARSATKTQMAKALRFELPDARLHAAFDALDLALASRTVSAPADAQGDRSVRLHVANGVWGDRSITFVPAFLDTLAVDYGASVRVTDFAHTPDAGRRAVNGWISDATEGKIAELLPSGSVTSDTRIVLANAMVLDATWASPFDPAMTAPLLFTRLDGSTASAGGMTQVDDLAYASGAGYQAVEIPYVGGKLAMDILLPDRGSFATLEASLDGDWLVGVLAKLATTSVSVTMPKFVIEGQTFSVADRLRALGMIDAFGAAADFGAMVDPASGQSVVLQDVLHQAYVKVGERGTEAAAATAGLASVTDAVADWKVTLTVDRPFFFVIRDRPTNTLLFVGRVVAPG
jgi:serpin B